MPHALLFCLLSATCSPVEFSDEDPAYVERFKTAFKKDVSERQANIDQSIKKKKTLLQTQAPDKIQDFTENT